MAKKKIDIVSNGTASQYDIVIEDSIEEAGAFSPARALQVGGRLVSATNRIPVIGSLNVVDATTDTNKLVIDDAGRISVKIENGPQRTPTMTRSTSSGTVAAGSVYVSIANIGNANATVTGTVLDPGFSVDFPTRPGETLNTIAYDATGTTLLIVRIA